jgi:transcriptional regulator with XRE-family HTH domain
MSLPYPMSADREQLIQLFEAKVQSFEALAGARFHALLPLKEGIIRLRAKKASCRTIAELLKQLGVTVSHNTVARFCRELCAPSQRTIWVHAEGLNLSNSVIITLFVSRLELLWCELYLCYETVFPGIRSQAFRGSGKSERLFYFKTGRGSGV